MKDLRIKRPDWCFSVLDYRLDQDMLESSKALLDEWFNKHVEPLNQLLADAVEVFSVDESQWDTESRIHEVDAVYKALLIGIEPIKQESCADVLRDWVEWADDKGPGLRRLPDDFEERAKAALERES